MRHRLVRWLSAFVGGVLRMRHGGPFLDAHDSEGDGVNDLEEIRIWIDTYGPPGP